MLVSYLYDDVDATERTSFGAHLTRCEVCRAELAELRGVRAQLARWTPPAFGSPQSAVTSHQSAVTDHRSWWREIPAWAQVAAALLFLGVSAGIANLDVRYDRDGLTVRTGWSKTVASVTPGSGPASSNVAQDVHLADRPWRADLAVLERQLRTEFRGTALQFGTARRPGVGLGAGNDGLQPQGDAILRRARALVEESERRQQRELALRVAEVIRDVDTQRQADLVKIDRNLGLIQNNTGVEMLKQRELLNYYLVRASQKQ